MHAQFPIPQGLVEDTYSHDFPSGHPLASHADLVNAGDPEHGMDARVVVVVTGTRPIDLHAQDPASPGPVGALNSHVWNNEHFLSAHWLGSHALAAPQARGATVVVVLATVVVVSDVALGAKRVVVGANVVVGAPAVVTGISAISTHAPEWQISSPVQDSNFLADVEPTHSEPSVPGLEHL